MDFAIGNSFSDLSFTEMEMIEGGGFWSSVVIGAVMVQGASDAIGIK